MTDCVHRCDDGWITTSAGLIPCPRHQLATHEEWANARYRPTGPPVAPPAAPNDETTRRGLAAARAALAPAGRTRAQPNPSSEDPCEEDHHG
jgi:hypothetical protein